MKILITGVSGFIGTVLYDRLSSEYEVYGISNNHIDKKNCFRIDLLKIKEVKGFFENNNFDLIIHLASLMTNNTNYNDFRLLTHNLKIYENLIESVKKYSSCYLINFSSSAVYPNVNGIFSEDDIVNPSLNSDCLYGLSKFNGEMLFNFFLKSNFKILNLRIGYVYGNGMDKTRIHEVFLNELKINNTITLYGNGLRVIPQISLEYLNQTIKKLIKKPIIGTYNLAEENISIKKIAQNIILLHGNKSSKIVYVELGNNQNFKLDISKIKNLF